MRLRVVNYLSLICLCLQYHNIQRDAAMRHVHAGRHIAKGECLMMTIFQQIQRHFASIIFLMTIFLVPSFL